MDLEILYILKKPDNQPGSSFEIAFTDTFGEKVKLLMQRKIIQSKTESKKWLLDHNFPNQDTDGWIKVFEILQAKEPTNNFGMLVNKTGFWDKGYLLPNGSFIGPKDKYALFLESGIAKYLPNCSVSGSLDDWKKTIAPAALNSSRIMLALCGGSFSGYLLKITGIECGGFHFEGMSSIGKTTLLKCAASTSGPVSNIQTWNFTEAAVEEIAYARNDGLICFDELKAVHHDPDKAAQLTTAAIYKLSLGIGKATSNQYNAEQYTWHIVILSTGEDSLAKHAKSGGIKRKLGEEVRMIDIPADAGEGSGIFEKIPDDYKNANEYVTYLTKQTQHCYGTAQMAFLEKFVSDLKDENAEIQIKKQIDKWMKLFRKDCGVADLGTEIRLANRFALAYAAGCLAVEYGVLPFTREDVFNGIAACYKAALAMKPESWEEKVKQLKSKLAKHLNSKEFLALDAKESWSKKEIEKNDGFSVSINNIPIIALKRDAVKRLIPEIYLNDVLNACKSKGCLLSDANGNNTRSITLNGKKVRFYCFVLPRDNESCKAVKEYNRGYAAKKSSEKKDSE